MKRVERCHGRKAVGLHLDSSSRFRKNPVLRDNAQVTEIEPFRLIGYRSLAIVLPATRCSTRGTLAGRCLRRNLV